MRAYEAYCRIWREQPALTKDGCRGGFSALELVALLYARTFPADEQAERFREACEADMGDKG